MKRSDLKPRRCPCGGWIRPQKNEKPYGFNKRQYCCNTCPVLSEKKADGSRIKSAIARKEQELSRTPESSVDPVNLFLMGKLA